MPAHADLASFAARLPVARRAAAWAAEVHAGQRREADAAPYIVHALEVGLLLHQAGYRDEVVAIGLVHDAVEKGPTSIDAVRAAFGDRIADAVGALSEDDAIADYVERKAALRARVAACDDDVIAVFAADKVVSARELRVAAAADAISARKAACKHGHYVASLELVEGRLPGHPSPRRCASSSMRRRWCPRCPGWCRWPPRVRLRPDAGRAPARRVAFRLSSCPRRSPA